MTTLHSNSIFYLIDCYDFIFIELAKAREFESRMLRHTHEIELALPDKAVVVIIERRKCM